MNQIKCFMVQLCLLLLTAQPHIANSELFSPNITGSDVYANSLAPGSQALFAIDDDFVHPYPTCLQTNPSQPDRDGWHWVMIDFGLVLRNVKEIRLAPDPGNKIYATKLSNIDAYIVRSGQYFSRSDEPNGHTQIPWHSNAFQLCSNSGNVTSGTRVASIQCPEALNGRWLALRKTDGDLNICLVSVYIQDAFHECFELQPIDPTSQTRYVGHVFQFMRHVTLSVCRSTCTSSKSCQAIKFKRRGRSGICELIDEFHIIESPSKDGQSQVGDLKKAEIACNADNCSIELNHCHLGTLEQLQKLDSTLDEETPNAENFMNEQLFQDWELDPVKQPATNALDLQSRFLVSVHLEGLMDCRSSNCGFLNVYSLDLNEEIDLCGSIDSRLVRRLDQHYLFCRSDPPIVGTQKLRLTWTNLDRHEFQVQIKAVQLRTTFDEMTFLRRVNKNLVKIDPELDEEEDDDQSHLAKLKEEGLESPEIFDTLNFTGELDESRNMMFYPREVSEDEVKNGLVTTSTQTDAAVTASTPTFVAASSPATFEDTARFVYTPVSTVDTKGTISIEQDSIPSAEPTNYHTRSDTMRKRDPSSMVNTLESASLDYVPEVVPKSRHDIYVEQRDEPQNGSPLLSGASRKSHHNKIDQNNKADGNPGIRLTAFSAITLIVLAISIFVVEF